MELSQDIVFKVFGVLVLGLGLYGLLRGRITVGIEGTERFNRTVMGRTARFVSLGFIAAGVTFVVNVTFGIVFSLVVMAVAWVLGAPNESPPGT